MQNHHSLIYREEEREMFPTLKVCSAPTPPLGSVQFSILIILTQLFGVGAIPWSPLGRGILTRPLKKQSLRGETDWQVTSSFLRDL